MRNEDYRKAYESAAKELDELLQRQAAMEERIIALRKTMNVLSVLCQQTGIDTSDIDAAHAKLFQMIESSLTEDILKIVNASSEPLTTADVRDQLKELGGSLAEHRNPLASINAILNRLVESNRVQVTEKDGRKAWRKLDLRLAGVNTDAIISRLAERWDKRVSPPPGVRDKEKK